MEQVSDGLLSDSLTEETRKCSTRKKFRYDASQSPLWPMLMMTVLSHSSFGAPKETRLWAPEEGRELILVNETEEEAGSAEWEGPA